MNWFILVAKSNFQKGGESLRRFRANPQVCSTFLEITFGIHSSRTGAMRAMQEVLASHDFEVSLRKVDRTFAQKLRASRGALECCQRS
jgi:hypothetical protein